MELARRRIRVHLPAWLLRLAAGLAAAVLELGVSSQCRLSRTPQYRHYLTSRYISSAMPESEPHTTRDEAQRKCSTCNIVFQRTTHLRRHMLTHTQDKRFVCSQCGKSFVRRFVIFVPISSYLCVFLRITKSTYAVVNLVVLATLLRSGGPVSAPLFSHQLTCILGTRFIDIR